MAWATCTACGREVAWRATRGARLRDLRCTCGGTLRGATSRRGRPPAVQCVVCQSRPRVWWWAPPEPFAAVWYEGAIWTRTVHRGPLHLSGPVCTSHRVVPASLLGGGGWEKRARRWLDSWHDGRDNRPNGSTAWSRLADWQIRRRESVGACP